MILKHEKWEFDIVLEGVTLLVIENRKLFRCVLNDINNQSIGLDGGFTLFSNLDEHQIQKEIVLVNTPFTASINDRKIISKLHTELKKDIISEEYDKFSEIENAILSFFTSLVFNHSIDLEVGKSIEILDLLRIAQVKFIEEDHYLDLIDRMVQYAIVVQEFINPTAIVYSNIKSMFLDDEWKIVVNELHVRDINALIIENKNVGIPKLERMVYTIDEDLCELY